MFLPHSLSNDNSIHRQIPLVPRQQTAIYPAPLQIQLIGLRSAAADHKFTSQSYREMLQKQKSASLVFKNCLLWASKCSLANSCSQQLQMDMPAPKGSYCRNLDTTLEGRTQHSQTDATEGHVTQQLCSLADQPFRQHLMEHLMNHATNR